MKRLFILIVAALNQVLSMAKFLSLLVLLCFIPSFLVTHFSPTAAYLFGLVYISIFTSIYRRTSKVNRGALRAAFVLMLSGLVGFKDVPLQIFVDTFIFVDGIITIRLIMDSARIEAYANLVNTINAHRVIGFGNKQLNEGFRRTIKYHRSAVEHYS